MATVHVTCPFCHAQMGVPQEFLGRQAKCKWCHRELTLRTSASLEDSVAAWLEGPGDEPETPPVPPKDATAARHVRIVPAAASQKPGAAGDSNAGGSGIFRPPAGSAEETPVRLARIEQVGAFFAFPNSLLYEPRFRASLPRCCLSCGATLSLTVNLVVWASKLPERDKLRSKSGSLRVRVLAEELIRLGSADLLKHLPKVPNLPPPYDLPMPYYICNRCSPAGQVLASVHPGPGGIELCELGIASLKRAAEFFARVAGRSHGDYQRLLNEDEHRRNDPWGVLPPSVRNRIGTWFKRAEGEQFMAYVHDNDFAPRDAGQGGLVLTNQRMVYHKSSVHREMLLHNRFELRGLQEAATFHLWLGSPGQKAVLLHCDPASAGTIRTTLKKLRTKYTYKNGGNQ